MIEIKCEICENKFNVFPCRKDTVRVCSPQCRGKLVGIIRRGRTKPRISTQGYYFILKPDHHRSNRNGYVKIADIILEEKIGRRLEKGEIAHHINHIRTDDSPKNLELMTKKEHDLLTIKERWSNWKKLNKWSIKYSECLKCKTKKYKHMARGHCTYCYKKYIERKK